MKPGRNDVCPCGSGKKYKSCCKEVINVWVKRINRLSLENSVSEKVGDIFINTMKFIEEKDWRGACHATASILYVLYKEYGLDPELYIGEVQIGNKYFDHSWLEISGKIIDVALMNTLDQGTNKNPIFFDYDVDTMQKSDLVYGVSSPDGLDSNTKWVLNTDLRTYMEEPPIENGLWSIVELIADRSQLKISINDIKDKYADTKRMLKR